MQKLIPSLLLALAIGASAQNAPTASFANPFTSHAVLQRDCELPVWGTAEPGANVAVALDDEVATGIADAKGKWSVKFPAQTKPGLGHTLSLSVNGIPVKTLNDIAIGDVWLCSGQSNMDMNYGWGLTRGKEDIEQGNDPMMRLFDDQNAVSIDPLDALTKPAAWKASDFAHSRSFSACGWFFGQALRKALPDVPIGLVEASWSGSPIKTWLSAEAYSSADPACAAEYAAAVKSVKDYIANDGPAEFAKRMELWKAECAAKGDIHAEGPDYDDSTWKAVSVPVKFEKQFNANFDGCAWYRRSVDLSAEQAAAEATLTLGPIDDTDETWVNGTLVGSNLPCGAPRVYPIPVGVLREGRNVIAVRITDNQGVGGFTGKPEHFALKTASGDISLAGEWRSVGFAFDPKPKSGDVSSWTPTACYNAMLHPLFPMALKGAIWYQGCSDVGHAPLYDKVLRAMAADWRAHFTHPDGLPLYIVQLAAFRETHANPINSGWADMRWTQMQLGETLEKSGTAVTIDIGHHTDIHPKDKKSVGERLARLALVRTYGVKDLLESGPIPVAATIANGKVSVSFKNGADLIISSGDALKGFQLAGADRSFQWVTAAIEGNTVALDIPEGMDPVTVRYAWDDYPDCNLVGAFGLPCGPFQLNIMR